MKLFARVLKGLGALMALGVTFYLIAVLVNLKDAPPSQTVEEFVAYYENQPEVPDALNSYYFQLGFGAPPDMDPAEIGLKRQEWFLQQLADGELDSSSDPLADDYDLRRGRKPEIAELRKTCARPEAGCFDSLAANLEHASQWLSDESWILDRYRTLIAMPALAEPMLFQPQAPIPSYSRVLDGQRLLLLSAWLAADDGDHVSVIANLDSELAYWRMVQKRADTLLTKMIAVVAIRRNFVSGNEVLRKLQSTDTSGALPETWRIEFGSDDRSMKRSLIGEWRFIDYSVQSLDAGPGNPLVSDYYSGATLFEKAAWRALMPLWQPQEQSNRHAQVMDSYIDLFDTDYRNIPAALEESELIAANNPKPFSRLYNLAGDILFAGAYAGIGDYAVRASDLEGIRRAAVITSQLRAQAVPAADIRDHLSVAEFTDPYSGAPFTWLDSRNEVIFFGLARGDRGKHEFRY